MKPPAPAQPALPCDRLIIGIDSQLGSVLSHHLAHHGHACIGTSRRDGSPHRWLDLGDRRSVEAFDCPEGIRIAYLLAAMTSLKQCRLDPVSAYRVNVLHSGLLVGRLTLRGVRVVMISTNQVFDGSRPWRRPDEPTCPLSVYGHTKAELEQVVLARDGCVVRPTKVLGPMPALWTQWREQWRRGQTVTAFDDLYIAPVRQRTLLDTLIHPNPGITHLSGDQDISYAQVAQRLAERCGVDPRLVHAGSAATAEIPPQERPRHSTLAGGLREPVWEVIDESVAPREMRLPSI